MGVFRVRFVGDNKGVLVQKFWENFRLIIKVCRYKLLGNLE